MTDGHKETSVRQLAREVSALQATLLGKLHEEMADSGAETARFVIAAQRLAEEFGSVTATAVDALCERIAAESRAADSADPQASLLGPGQVRRRLERLIETHQRYGHPFALVVFDVDGPGTREGDAEGGQETALAIVAAALRDSIRLVDETFRVEENGICVLAPNQGTVEGVQMAQRLLGQLQDLEQSGGLPIRVSAGVVSCPEHGAEAGVLLQKADEAMWRARAVSQPVGVGALQDR